MKGPTTAASIGPGSVASSGLVAPTPITATATPSAPAAAGAGAQASGISAPPRPASPIVSHGRTLAELGGASIALAARGPDPDRDKRCKVVDCKKPREKEEYAALSVCLLVSVLLVGLLRACVLSCPDPLFQSGKCPTRNVVNFTISGTAPSTGPCSRAPPRTPRQR